VDGSKKTQESATNEASIKSTEDEAGVKAKDGSEKAEPEQDLIDISNFKFALNPDVFSGQVPQTDAEMDQWAQDEKDVRDACDYLQSEVIPELVRHSIPRSQGHLMANHLIGSGS
jgi:protein TIF31